MTSWKLALTKWIPDKLYLQLLFFKHFGRFINFKNPKTFNEKLQWLKLYDRNPEYTRMVDKYEAKKYVAEKIGEEYIIPTLGVWDTPEEIDFDSLPDQFVLKWNHDSGSIVICKDKKNFDKAEVIKKLQRGKQYSGFWYGREWPYKNVRPRVIAETYLSNDGYDLKDYKFYCFNGKVKCLYISKGLSGLHENAEISFYDLEWHQMPLKRADFKELTAIPPKPNNFQKMIHLAKLLSSDIPFVRVDFYEVENHVLFSELTFYPCGGLMKFEPFEYDLTFGQWLELPNRPKIIC